MARDWLSPLPSGARRRDNASVDRDAKPHCGDAVGAAGPREPAPLPSPNVPAASTIRSARRKVPRSMAGQRLSTAHRVFLVAALMGALSPFAIADQPGKQAATDRPSIDFDRQVRP